MDALIREQVADWEIRHAHDYFEVNGAYADAMAEAYADARSEPERTPCGDYIVFSDNMSVLELGCGYGGYGCRIAPHVGRYVGVDISSAIVEHGNEAIGLAGIPNMTLLAVPDCDPAGVLKEEFDVVFSTALLIHTPPEITRRYLEATAQLLKPSGRFSHQINMAREGVAEVHHTVSHTYSEESYEGLFVGSGLTVELEVDGPDFVPGHFGRFCAGVLEQSG